MTSLIQVHGWRHLEVSSLWPPDGTLKSKLLAELGTIPDVILFWESYRLCHAYLPELIQLPGRKCIFLEDLHMRNEQDRLARRDLLLHFDTILASCEYLLDDFYPGVRARKETAWVPHSASPDFVMTCAEAPQNAILLSAAVTAHYPLRQRMKTLFQEKRFPIVYHEHPGYHCNFDYESSNDIGKAYAQMINSCRASFVDSSVFGYVVAKYFEIPAAGSVLLADDAVWKPLEQLGFQAGVHYIGVSSRDLEDAIQYVLHAANWPILDEMRRRAQQLVLTRHTTSDRARLIDQVCRPV